MSIPRPSPAPSSPERAVPDDEGDDLAINAVKLVPAAAGPHQTPEKFSPQPNTSGPHQAA